MKVSRNHREIQADTNISAHKIHAYKQFNTHPFLDQPSPDDELDRYYHYEYDVTAHSFATTT